MSESHRAVPRRGDRFHHDGLLRAGSILFALIAVLNPFGCSPPPPGQGATTARVSISSNATEANDSGFDASVSGDGEVVAFASSATNLVEGDTNGITDVFVHDHQTGQTTRVSVSSDGVEASGLSLNPGVTGTLGSFGPAISADRRFVAFRSSATNLVAGDVNGTTDIFVHDRQTGETTRASVDSAGAEANGASSSPSISADGRHVVFDSSATNLVTGDTNGISDVFVHDRQTGETTRVSVSSAGGEADGRSSGYRSWVSDDGEIVAFNSAATNLVEGDTNGIADVFVHDRQTGETTRVSVSSAGTEANEASFSPSISADGRHVVFLSEATDLVASDTNGRKDVFAHDRQTGETTRVSVSSDGAEANNISDEPAISADGRHVVFFSLATNLVADDGNAKKDIFVHDRQTGETTRASITTLGAEANDDCDVPSISADGRYVVFESSATNLVADDTNREFDIFVRDRGE